MSDEPRSERFRVRAATPLRRETLIRPEPALGLVAMNGPGDPEPSLAISDGIVSELDVIAQHLSDVAAPHCAAFVREAAAVMAERGLLRAPG